MVVADVIDQEARERIHTDLASTLFVEAGAGTGKTKELIERIVRLVATGTARLRDTAAITFTESAAAELRDRVRLRLEEAEQDDVNFSDEERERCTVALTELDGAAIETLHGFAQRILTEHPLEAGLPPLIEVQDEISANITFDERWSAFVDELLGDTALEDVLLRAFTMGLDLEALREIAWAMHENWDRIEDNPLDEQTLIPVNTRALADQLIDVAALRKHCIAHDDKLFIHLEGIERYARKLASADSELDQLRLLTDADKFNPYVGQKDNWQGVSASDVRDELKDAQQRREALLEEIGANLLPSLLNAVRGFILTYAAERRHDGRLEFHDLLVLARDLLRGNAAVRAALRAKFTHILIDEFQDTDPLQIEIAVLLASGAEARRWQDMAVDEGRLFFVGDVKQSIYRFRRADIELYQTAQRIFADGLVRLQQNWRSISPIIDWINLMFADLMGEGNGAGQAAYLSLEPARDDGADGPRLQLIGGPSEAKNTRVAAIREREAKEIAQTVLAAKAERWQVTDERTGETRDAKFADIAILLPTRTPLQVLEDALEAAGIPYRVESQSLIYNTQDVRDLLSILRSIDDPTDEPALIAALRAPAFACADDDLLRYHQAGGRWDYRRDPPEIENNAVPDAMRSLHQLHTRRWWEPINVIVEAVIRERRLFEMAFTHRRPRERWQRLRFLLDQARAFAEAGGRTLRQFIDWAERQAEEDTRVVETVVPEPDDDAVRVMTIHAAKGLEFPIVILDGLNMEKSSQGRSTQALWHPGGRLEARIKEKHFETAGYEERAHHEEGMDALEKVRLLYVAATRARDHLIVSLHHRLGSESLASRLHALCASRPKLRREVKPVLLPDEKHEPLSFDDSPEKLAAWRDDRAQRIERGRRVPAISATEVVRRFAEVDDPNVDKDPPVEEVPPWRRGRAGTALGRAVHAVLQSIDLDTGADLESACRAQADAEGIAPRWQEVARTVRAALESAAVREAVAGGRYWRELFVSAPADGTTVEGFIDLLYETDEGLVVVDYKTDRAPGDNELADALERYTPQGATYALAIEHALGRSVSKCTFVFVEPGRARERDVIDLPGAIARVRDELGSPTPGASPSAAGAGQLSLPGLDPEETR